MKKLSVALVTLVAAGLAGAAQAECKFQKIAEVPVTMDGMRPTITAQINGQDAHLTVSTGSFFSGVNPEAAAKYGMKRAAAPVGMEVRGIGGATRSIQAVSAESFSFAGMGFHHTEFLLADRLGGGPIAGDVGENLMGPFDVEYDFAHGVMRYFKPEGCGYDTNLAYWSQGLAVSRLSLIEPTTILTKVIANAKVDGHTIRVSFSSGGGLSILSRAAAGRAGIKINDADVTRAGVTYGMYGKGLEAFLAPFASFAIGEEEIKNTRLRVADLDLPNADMVLAADFFLSHRILISNSQKRVYFTYNGGPVFRLDQAPTPATTAVAAAASEAPGGSPGVGARPPRPAPSSPGAGRRRRRGASSSRPSPTTARPSSGSPTTARTIARAPCCA